MEKQNKEKEVDYQASEQNKMEIDFCILINKQVEQGRTDNRFIVCCQRKQKMSRKKRREKQKKNDRKTEGKKEGP